MHAAESVQYSNLAKLYFPHTTPKNMGGQDIWGEYAPHIEVFFFGFGGGEIPLKNQAEKSRLVGGTITGNMVIFATKSVHFPENSRNFRLRCIYKTLPGAPI